MSGGTEYSERIADKDIVDLIDTYPLASVITHSGDFAVSSLPMLAETNPAGGVSSLLGHIPKNNPHRVRMAEQPRALFLFSGPQGYISPEYVTSSRSWAPTWNFAVVRITADVTVDESLTEEALQRLVQHMERGRPMPWSIPEMGERYHQLKERVIGFRANIIGIEARFKLGQDERPDVLSSIVDSLDGTDLAAWMRRFNPEA